MRALLVMMMLDALEDMVKMVLAHREQLWTLTEARVVIEDYRREYNQRRPHSRLGYQSPARFAAQCSPSPSAVGDGQIQNPSAK